MDLRTCIRSKRTSLIILDDKRQNPFEDQATHTRSYTLKSTSCPKWSAKVLVTASTVRELSQCRLSTRLSVESVGFDKSGRRMCGFSAVGPDESFNTIHDDKPLDGWWRWPQRAPRSPKKAGETGERLNKMRKEWKELRVFAFGV